VLVAAAQHSGKAVPAYLQGMLQQVRADEEHVALADMLLSGERRAIFLGALAMRHPAWADLRLLAAALAGLCGARLGYLPEGANAAGAALAGALPHREAGGEAAATGGLDARAMIHAGLKAYVLTGGVEPDRDLAVAQSETALRQAGCVVALTPFAGESLLKVAQVLLPTVTFAETAGTFVNIEGRWQSFPGAARPVGQSRPGWKVLRVLGTLLDLPGFDYGSVEDVRAELQAKLGEVRPDNSLRVERAVGAQADQGSGVVDVPMYQVDALVRRAPALQRTRDGQQGAVTY
jgi:NADH-quinone oxidoreductase subunit G